MEYRQLRLHQNQFIKTLIIFSYFIGGKSNVMAKQIGIVRLKCTIDGINYYKTSVGGHLARVGGGGFNSKNKNKPNMVRAMENANEFGRCSMLKKQFKIALNPFLCVRKDPRLHGRMMQLFTEIKGFDILSKRGERNFGNGLLCEKGKLLLENFNFTPDFALSGLLKVFGSYNFVERKYKITNFDVRNIKFPSGSTHMALTLGLLHFDFRTLQWDIKTSVPFYIDKSFDETEFEIMTGLPQTEGNKIAVMGLKFYQKIQDTFYLLKSADSVGIEILGFRNED